MMIENISDIQSGMDVYGTDGEKIGSVADIYASSGYGTTSGTTWQAGAGDLDVETVNRTDTTFRDPTARGADYTNDTVTGTTYTDPTSSNPGFTTPSTGTTDFTATSPETIGSGIGAATMPSNGYIKVESGGFLGLGATDLYIPFTDVTSVVPGDNITISCTKDECSDRYSQKPAFLNDQDNSPTS